MPILHEMLSLEASVILSISPVCFRERSGERSDRRVVVYEKKIGACLCKFVVADLFLSF